MQSQHKCHLLCDSAQRSPRAVSKRAAGPGQERKGRPRWVTSEHLAVITQTRKLLNVVLSSCLDKYTFELSWKARFARRRPPWSPTACCGRVAMHQPIDDPSSSHLFCLHLSSLWMRAGGHQSPHILLNPQEREWKNRMPNALAGGTASLLRE